jgi:purine nucleoside phosphorylase
MVVGIITGSGTYTLPGFEGSRPAPVETEWGDALVTRGKVGEVDVVHISRHGEGHVRLSNHVLHRPNIAALKEAGADCVIGLTACGAVDRSVALGTLICFDDLHFPVNRLPDRSLCTFYSEAGDRRRGHWIYEDPYSPAVRTAVLEAARETGRDIRDGGCYGHVDGPRFNTKAEIRALDAAGVTAVSQTGGSETVLCGELELPFALVGFATDYANGVADEATPVEQLIALMGRSSGVFADLIGAALPRIDAEALAPVGVVYRFDQGLP